MCSLSAIDCTVPSCNRHVLDVIISLHAQALNYMHAGRWCRCYIWSWICSHGHHLHACQVYHALACVLPTEAFNTLHASENDAHALHRRVQGSAALAHPGMQAFHPSACMSMRGDFCMHEQGNTCPIHDPHDTLSANMQLLLMSAMCLPYMRANAEDGHAKGRLPQPNIAACSTLQDPFGRKACT